MICLHLHSGEMKTVKSAGGVGREFSSKLNAVNHRS